MCYGVALEDGSVVTAARLHSVIDEEMARIATEQGAARMERGRFADARKLFEELSTAPTFEEFLTLPAYQMLG